MKRMALLLGAVLGLLVAAGTTRASWSAICYSGYQPWWNIFAKRYKCLTPEEERLQKFWHDYYDALKNFYCDLDHIDWVAYYKNHGYQINAGCGPYGGNCCGRINYAPVFVTPGLQWAMPCGAAGGPAVGPPPGYGAGPMPYGPGYPGMQMGPPPGYMAGHSGPMPGMFPGTGGGMPLAGPIPGQPSYGSPMMGGSPTMGGASGGGMPMLPNPMGGSSRSTSGSPPPVSTGPMR